MDASHSRKNYRTSVIRSENNRQFRVAKTQKSIKDTSYTKCQLRDEDDFDNFPLPTDLPQNPDNSSHTSSQVIDRNVSQSLLPTIFNDLIDKDTFQTDLLSCLKLIKEGGSVMTIK